MNEIERIKIKGKHTFSFYDMHSINAQRIEKWIQGITVRRNFLVQTGSKELSAFEDLHKQFQYCKKQLQEFKLREFVVYNITTTVGREVSAKILAGTYGSTGAVTHTALGDDNTTPTVGDTLLGNETTRKALSDGNTNGAQTLLETFFSTSEAVGTHEEFGMFIDGTASADSGVLFNRFIQTVVKSNTESMNVQSTIDFQDA